MVTKLMYTETCTQELKYIFQIYIKLLTNDNKCRHKIKHEAHTSAYNSMKLKVGKAATHFNIFGNKNYL